MEIPTSQTPLAAAAPPPAPIVWAAYSHVGRARAANEDAYALPLAADPERRGALLALADGAGGLEGGAEAAFAAVHYAQALYYAPPGPDDPAARLPQVVEAVNALNRLAQRRAAADAPLSHLTTLIVAAVFPSRLWIANLGDSRAYLLQPGAAPLQLTEDHRGRVQQSKAATLPSPPAAHPDLPPNLITRAIGLSDACQVDVYRYPWNPPQRLLLCSDGLFALPPERLTELACLPDLAQAARALVAAAVALDGQDNCTAILACHAPGEAA